MLTTQNTTEIGCICVDTSITINTEENKIENCLNFLPSHFEKSAENDAVFDDKPKHKNITKGLSHITDAFCSALNVIREGVVKIEDCICETIEKYLKAQ